MRALMGRKRRSNPQTDEAEDGGRAIAIEEGISALVFAYASRHHYLEGKNHIDNDILDTIQVMVAHLEVGAHRAADWEKAILTGFTAWRRLRRLGGGTVRFDLHGQRLTVVEPERAALAGPTEVANTFKAVVTNLHRRKDASYGNSWKRRGELISIMANIARKVDRLNIVATTLASTADENALDTAVDLYVYALKYLTFLADADPNALPDVLPPRDDDTRWSDGPDGLERLLSSADLDVLDRPADESIHTLVTAVDHAFANLEGCFSGDAATSPPARRAELAKQLANQALLVVAALRASHPEMYQAFLATWKN